MNIRDLSYIEAVARLGNFGRAALACNVSQPALSTQIKKLEEELGVTLFERTNRAVHLTPVGQEIIALAKELLQTAEHIRATAQAAQDPLSGPFQLGLIPTIAPYLIPCFVQAAKEALPNVELQFQEDITERLTAALLERELDAAILATPPDNSKLDVIRLYDEPFWVLFPVSHRLHGKDVVRTSDLPVEELLLLTEGHCFRDQALDVCRLGGAPESRSIRATSLATLVNMVAVGQGITLVPAMALGENNSARRNAEMTKLDDVDAYRRIYLTFRKKYPRQKLLDILAQIICQNLPRTVSQLL